MYGPYKYEQIQYKYLPIDNGRREVDGPTQLIFVLVFYLSTCIHVEKDEAGQSASRRVERMDGKKSQPVAPPHLMEDPSY